MALHSQIKLKGVIVTLILSCPYSPHADQEHNLSLDEGCGGHTEIIQQMSNSISNNSHVLNLSLSVCMCVC